LFSRSAISLARFLALASVLRRFWRRTKLS
jgi:hypothetical protein